MPLVGFLAAEGRLSLPGGIAAGTAGSVAGAYAWFLVARRIGADRIKRWADRHGRWLTVSPDDIDGVLRWFQRHGAVAVLVGRLVPAVRTLISVPAGIARMPTPRFLLWSTAGTLAWSGTLAVIGYLLGDRYEEIAGSVGIFANIVIGSAVLLYVYRVVTFRR
jgi:membrane protein DedA with SNARE-associated domain